MDGLSRDINSLENSVARYIYIKYIQDRIIVPEAEVQSEVQSIIEKGDSSDSQDASSSSEDDESNEDKKKDTSGLGEKTKKVRPKVLDKLEYNIYRKNVFHQSRKCFALDQNAIVREDVRVMKIADAAYDKNPEKFKISDYELPPDVLRCSFIRKHHHRYYRCRNMIMNKDSDICRTHETRENIYYDNYNDLLEQIIN